MTAREGGGFAREKSDGHGPQPVGMEDRTEWRVVSPMVMELSIPAAGAGHSEARGRALQTLVVVRPEEAEVGRSLARQGGL